MNSLLIFFVLPIATIIISIALQKIFKCPLLVAAIVFAVFLIVTFIINDLNFLVATIIYTIISFLTALLVCAICRFLNGENDEISECTCCSNNCQESNIHNQVQSANMANLAQNSNGHLLADYNYNFTENNNYTSNNDPYNNSNTDCNSNIINSNGVATRINVIPNNYTKSRYKKY